ncbi:MAG: DndE family protein, partial [Proteobacteria bacterium]|nr:DndE family protein [Pseudomonadota bacterium]
EEPNPPIPEQYPPGNRDINRYTLTGEYDDLFVALLRQRLLEDELDWETHATEQFACHMNRGVLLLSARGSTLPDLLTI